MTDESDRTATDMGVIQFGTIAAVVFGAAYAFLVYQADLSDRPRMKALLLATAVSYFTLAFGLANLRPRLSAASFLSSLFLICVVFYVAVDKYYKPLDRLDFAFSVVAVLVICLILGRPVAGVLRLKRRAAPAVDRRRGS